MARQLTKKAKETVLSNASVYLDVCELMDVKPASLPPLIYRNSNWLTNHDVVLVIAKAMNKKPDEILEEVPEKEPAG